MLWKVMQNKEGLTVDADHVVAITNGGGIRAAIKPGDVTKKDINTVLPFGNTVAVIYVTGAELLEALEASTYSLPVGGFPQVAGINFTLSTAVAYDANAETYPASTYYGPKSINRVVINSINGKEFKADDTYAVVTNNFVAGGGDTYYAFAAASAQFDTGIPLDEAVMEYVTTELKGVIGAQYAAPQGRILMNPFKDVKTSAWYGSYVIDLYNDGIINGTSATTYAPNDTLTWLPRSSSCLSATAISRLRTPPAPTGARTPSPRLRSWVLLPPILTVRRPSPVSSSARSLPSSTSLPSPRPRASSLTAPTVT